MKTAAIITAVAAAVGAAVAAPAPNPSEHFYLVSKSNDTRFDNLCIAAYHTGAGFADATFAKCTPDFKKKLFYQHDHSVYFTGYSKKYPSPIQVNNDEIMYDEWGPVTIDVTKSTNNLEYTEAEGFIQTQTGYGFIGCMWAHGGTKQLFAKAVENPTIIETCAELQLFKGY